MVSITGFAFPHLMEVRIFFFSPPELPLVSPIISSPPPLSPITPPPTHLHHPPPLPRPGRTLVSDNPAPRPLATPRRRPRPAENVLVQPCNRDTGPGILWSLLAIERRCPGAHVAMFPSDHYVANGAAFRACVRQAGQVVEQSPDKLVLLGIEPDHPASGYGYVVPSSPLQPGDAGPAYHVATFREKPDRALARRILRRGAMWNSLVMVVSPARVLELVAEVQPEAFHAMATVGAEPEAIERHYASAAPWNFSSGFLAHVAHAMVVLRAEDTGWSDWGTRQSIERTFAALNQPPPWHVASAPVRNRRERAARRVASDPAAP